MDVPEKRARAEARAKSSPCLTDRLNLVAPDTLAIQLGRSCTWPSFSSSAAPAAEVSMGAPKSGSGRQALSEKSIWLMD